MGGFKPTTTRSAELTGCGEILVDKILREHIQETLNVMELAWMESVSVDTGLLRW